MTNRLTERLNAILPRITSDEFLAGRGLGNEIAFFIFDYPPEAELTIREHITHLLTHLPKARPGLKVQHINLLDFVVSYLQKRNLLEKAIQMQQRQGNQSLLKALSGPLREDKLVEVFVETYQPADCDLILLSGVGSVWPLLRTHALLNNLHSCVGKTPLVLFYPGAYDGQSLALFGKFKGDNYYRAFRLVP